MFDAGYFRRMILGGGAEIIGIGSLDQLVDVARICGFTTLLETANIDPNAKL